MSTITLNNTITDIILRSEKEAELTHAELDGNFSNLAAKANELDDTIYEIDQRVGANETSLATIVSDVANLSLAIAEKANITDLPSVTELVADIDYLKSKIVAQIVLDDDGNVVHGYPALDNDDAPYKDVARLALEAGYGQLNDELLIVTSGGSGDTERYDITISATFASTSQTVEFGDLIVVSLAKYINDIKYSKEVYINGKKIFDLGVMQEGVTQIGGLPNFVIYFNMDSTKTVNVPVNAAIDYFLTPSRRGYELFVPKKQGLVWYEGLDLISPTEFSYFESASDFGIFNGEITYDADIPEQGVNLFAFNLLEKTEISNRDVECGTIHVLSDIGDILANDYDKSIAYNMQLIRGSVTTSLTFRIIDIYSGATIQENNTSDFGVNSRTAFPTLTNCPVSTIGK